MRRRATALAGLAALSMTVLAACNPADPLGGELGRQPVRVVFFEDDSVALFDQAKAALEDAATIARRYPTAPVRVLGFAAPDTDHTPIAGLSRARAQHVAAELVSRGVPRARITVESRGAVAFEAVPIESRRVEIHIGN